jgi:ATPase components of ABC transporters with duplicated ATPase domains
MVIIDPPQETLKLLRQALNTNDPADEESMEILAYVASLASSLASTQNFDSSAWIDILSPYLSEIFSCGSLKEGLVCDEAIENFRALSEKAALADLDDESDEEDDFGGEELCNIRFSLAYGGKILLHQTKLRLRRGHRYALVGQNG